MKRFLICLTVVFMALAFVNCKTGGEGSSALPGGGKFNLSDLFGKGKGKITEPELGDIDTEYKNGSTALQRLWLPRELPDKRIAFKEDQYSWGDIRVPKTDKLKTAAGYPVVVVIHGGAWRVDQTYDRLSPLAEALTGLGAVTWNIEFARLGNTGGGYPNTFLEVGMAVDYLRVLAPEYNLDLSRVIVLGHSSGGLLGLWVSSRHNIDPSSPLYVADPLPIKGIISMGSIANMETAYAGGRTDVWTLLGVSNAADAALLYPNASPYLLLPTGVPTAHFVGTLDGEWRIEGLHQYSDTANALGTPNHIHDCEGATEIVFIDPCAPSWALIVQELFWLLDEPPPTFDVTKSQFCPMKGKEY